MNNFEFYNPVKLLFGKGKIADISNEIPKEAKILITYGGGSISRNGVYDQVKEALKGYDVSEFGGIEPNPDYNTLMRAVEQCRRDNIDYLLAVGGGSVIDGTKFIASAVKYQGDPWEFMLKPSLVGEAVDFATVLTLPATGSEMNCGAVISRRDRNEKYAFSNEKGFPQFSVLDPTVIYSLPKRQIANGIIDSYVHVMEQYLTVDNKTMLMDRWAESVLKTLIDLAPSLMKDDKDYDVCANFMISATMALNGFISMGVVEDWATHMIGHELTALHGLDHAVTLAIVEPALMAVMAEEKSDKLSQYAERVWDIKPGDKKEMAMQAIKKTEEFFNSLDVPTHLSDYDLGDDTINTIVERFRKRGWKLGENRIVTPDKVEQILNKAR